MVEQTFVQRVYGQFTIFLISLFLRFISVFFLVFVQVLIIEILLFFSSYTLSIQDFIILFVIRLLYVFSAIFYSRVYRYSKRYASENNTLLLSRAMKFFGNGILFFLLSLLLSFYFLYFIY